MTPYIVKPLWQLLMLAWGFVLLVAFVVNYLTVGLFWEQSGEYILKAICWTEWQYHAGPNFKDDKNE
jgi:hypothetical protein